MIALDVMITPLKWRKLFLGHTRDEYRRQVRITPLYYQPFLLFRQFLYASIAMISRRNTFYTAVSPKTPMHLADLLRLRHLRFVLASLLRDASRQRAEFRYSRRRQDGAASSATPDAGRLP